MAPTTEDERAAELATAGTPRTPGVEGIPPPRESTEGPLDEAASDAYRVKLDGFEGPLDLLLHLIRKHELDILNIPVSFITSKYLEYLDLMQALQIDVASEYLVMAATLTHIKSKMLLPVDPTQEGEEEGDGEEIDPRAELVRRLLEYQKYKHAAEQLDSRAAVGRDLFTRGTNEPVAEGPAAPLAVVSVFKLFDAFERVLKHAHQTADHQVLFERVSIAERIVELTELLHDQKRMRFEDLFVVVDDDGRPVEPTRLELVVTFLALLEMCKMRVARIRQDEALGELEVEFAAKHLDKESVRPPAPAADAEDVTEP